MPPKRSPRADRPSAASFHQGERPLFSGLSSGRLAAGVFVSLLAVRLLMFLHFQHLEFYQILALDSKFYHEWAVRIATGAGGYEGCYFQGPLYPWFLVIVYRLFGTNILAAQMAQICLGAVSAALIYLLGERVFDRRTGLLAAGFFGFYGYLMFIESYLLLEPLLLFLLLVSLHLLLSGAHRERWLPVAGLAIGAMALGRGSFLAVGLLAMAAYVLAGRDVQAKRRMRRAGLIMVGVTVAIAPATLHNLRAGEPVLISANGGINYFIGNHENAKGTFVAIEGVEFFQPGAPHDGGSIAVASAAEGKQLGAAGASRYWLRKGLLWNLENPARTVVLWGRKLLMALNDTEIAQIESFEWAQRTSLLLRVWPVRFGWLMALGLVGIVAAWRNGERARLLVLAFGAMLVPLVLFFVTARFRVVLVPLVAVFAARAVQLLWTRWRRGGRRHAIGLLAAAGILAIIVHLPVVPREGGYIDVLYHYTLGVKDMKLGRLEDAVVSFQNALRLEPRHVPSLGNLANCYLFLGQAEKSLQTYRILQQVDPHNERVLYLIGAAEERTGRLDDAAKTLLRLLRAQPDNWRAHIQLGKIYARLGLFTEAEACWLGVLQRAGDGPWRVEAEALLKTLPTEID